MARYIDADNLIKKMREQYNNLSNEDGYYDHFTQGYEDALSTVENEPTADVQKVRYGEWIESDYGICHCSECGFEYKSKAEVTQYCPVCGANMGGGESDES
nr:MAG TPA: DNA-directed RNA polymerase II subunit [Caudoviricetes sp.]